MDDFLNFLHDLMPSSWFDSVISHFGTDLNDDQIAESIKQASDFFNMNAPMEVKEGWTTGVITGMTFTENDDILIFNKQQLSNMGITDREGFDLVMTHEGAHRALQGMETGYNDHQEELCCDYMAGVRAGLNGMDEGKMADSLVGTTETQSHPGGSTRVEAIEAGVAFAHDFMEKHNDIPPTFCQCLDYFNDLDICKKAGEYLEHETNQSLPELVTLSPESTNTEHGELKAYTQSDIDYFEKQARITSGSEQSHWLDKAKWARNHIHGYVSTDINEASSHGLHGDRNGKPSGDYWDDSCTRHTGRGW